MLLPVLGAIFLSSCATNKDTIYFNNLKDSTTSITLSQFSEPVIQSDDILSITIQTINPSATSSSIGMPAGIGMGESISHNGMSGYLVDSKGEVQLPMIGSLKLKGLTTNQAKDLILNKASLYLKDPVVQVRFANFKVTVIGEVNKPATYTIPSEKVSILDIVGMAGDLTIYGRRENIMLIRDNAGKKDIFRLNLASSSIIESPYFYLKQNDVIYVQPNNSRTSVNNRSGLQVFSVVSSLISIAVLLITRL